MLENELKIVHVGGKVSGHTFTCRRVRKQVFLRCHWKLRTVPHLVFWVFRVLSDNRRFLYSTGTSAPCRTYTPFFIPPAPDHKAARRSPAQSCPGPAL